MTVHYVNGFTDSPTADCCGATLALLDASEITLNLDAVTCNQEEPAPSRAQDGDEVPLSVPGRIDIDAVRTDLVKVSNPHMATAARGIVTSRLLGAIPEMLREIRQYRTQTPAPAASSPVPQAATGTVAEPSAAAAPVARTDGCTCADGGVGWCAPFDADTPVCVGCSAIDIDATCLAARFGGAS